MATTFPTSLQALDNLGPTASMGGNHSALHTDVNDTIEALQAKVGITDSAVTTSHDYRIAALEVKTAGLQKIRVLSAVAAPGQTRTVDIDEGLTNTVTADQGFILNFTGPDSSALGSIVSVYVYNSSASAFTITTDLERFDLLAAVTFSADPDTTTILRTVWDGKGMWLLTDSVSLVGDRRPPE